MSKSGVYAHFASKQDLQLATIDTAREIFIEVVCRPVATRPGEVRDRIAREQLDWIAMIERLVIEARDLGELAPDTDPAQLAFELNALVLPPTLPSCSMPTRWASNEAGTPSTGCSAPHHHDRARRVAGLCRRPVYGVVSGPAFPRHPGWVTPGYLRQGLPLLPGRYD